MVALIAVIMVAGIIGAYFLMGDQSGFQLGTLFSGADLSDEAGEYTCTITIRCDTVLSNKGKLNEAKAPYIPDDGIILAQQLFPNENKNRYDWQPKNGCGYVIADARYEVLTECNAI